MAFMELQSEFGRWYLVETRNGTEIVPADVVGGLGLEVGQTWTQDDVSGEQWNEVCRRLIDYTTEPTDRIYSVELVKKWGARYSAPGYMDCTDWVLADTQEAAEEECRAMYGSDDEEDEDDDSEE